MTNKEAIVKADVYRPNDIPDGIKADWLMEVEARFAESMGVDMPENLFPAEQTLLMPFPHDECYVNYIAAKIDVVNQEGSLYQNDMMMFNSSMSEALAWWRRNHKPTDNRGIII